MKSVPIDRLGFLLHDSARMLRRRFEKQGRRHGLSSAQWRLLVRVVKEEGIAQARLAELLEIEPISVSRLIDRMAEAGWIERRPDPRDRRVRTIFPTAQSRAAYGEIKSHAAEVYEEALNGLDSATRSALIVGLETIVSNLSDGDAQAPATHSQDAAA